MPLNPGVRIGPYEIVAAIGAGGMGEVYRARDTKLDREVALKILPEAFASDGERLARFDREARTLAALNHTHIAHIHGLDESGDHRALVMELVEGPTLADRIRRGPIPVDEAMPIARQLAEALEYAHERGVVHRDLKPANVKVTPEGAVKVLDFGLARAFETAPDEVDPTSSPTFTSQDMTRAGVILGTAAYMSPEQARGATVDKRTDIWAFGVVFYEMLTGRRGFDGPTVTDVLAAVVKSEPDWSALPPTTPRRIRELLRRCITKDRKQRLHDIADARLDIEQAMNPAADELLADAAAVPPVASALPRRGIWRIVPWALAALGAILAAWTANELRGRPETPASAGAHLSIELPDGLQLVDTPPALSPDGRRLAFSALGRSGIAIYLRDLESFDVREVEGSEGGLGPFFSPDGQWLGFNTGVLVKKVPVGGGQATTLARPPFWVLSAAWAPDGQIVISGTNGGLWALPAEPGRAGEGVELTHTDQAQGERVHQRPLVVRDGRVLFTIVRDGDSLIGVYDPATKQTSRLPASGSPVAYLPSGHLVFQQAGRLVAAPFDLATTTLGSPVSPVLADAAFPLVAFSGTGLVAYLHHPQGVTRNLVLVDRTGVAKPFVRDAADYRWPRLSPDGRRLAVGHSGRRISVVDLQTGSRVQLQDDGENTEPVWTRDGRRLIYSSVRGASADADLYWQPADGSGTSELLSHLASEQWPTSVSPDGRLLAFYVSSRGKENGIWTVTLDQGHEASQLLSLPGSVRGARFSPDGRWLAYSSDETGRSEVYVRPFPGLDAKWSISSQGGTSPTWSPDGRELFYRDGARMMVAEVATSPAFSARPPRVLFEGPFVVDRSGDIDYDVTPDGTHFVMMLVDRAAQPRLRVLTQWAPQATTR